MRHRDGGVCNIFQVLDVFRLPIHYYSLFCGFFVGWASDLLGQHFLVEQLSGLPVFLDDHPGRRPLHSNFAGSF